MTVILISYGRRNAIWLTDVFFTSKIDQIQISPATSPEILHHTERRAWLFIAYSDERWSHYQFSLISLIHFFLKAWENVLFELGSERGNFYGLITLRLSFINIRNILTTLGLVRAVKNHYTHAQLKSSVKRVSLEHLCLNFFSIRTVETPPSEHEKSRYQGFQIRKW